MGQTDTETGFPGPAGCPLLRALKARYAQD